jgi:hypothetical protein
MGVKNEDMPPKYKDSVVAQTPQSNIGAITVTKMGGVKDTATARVLRKLELKTGREALIDAFAATENLSPAATRLRDLLGRDKRASLAFLTAKTGTSPSEVLGIYARGMAQLKKNEALIETYSQLPDLVRDMMKHALDSEGMCAKCDGTGQLQRKKSLSKEMVPVRCARCGGTGRYLYSSEHKEWATKATLEITKMLGEKVDKSVNVNVGVAVQPQGGSFAQKVLDVSDEILRSKPIDVLPENS